MINVINITLNRFCYFILLEFENLRVMNVFFYFRKLNASVVQIILTGLSVKFLLYYSNVNVVISFNIIQRIVIVS